MTVAEIIALLSLMVQLLTAVITLTILIVKK